MLRVDLQERKLEYDRLINSTDYTEELDAIGAIKRALEKEGAIDPAHYRENIDPTLGGDITEETANIMALADIIDRNPLITRNPHMEMRTMKLNQKINAAARARTSPLPAKHNNPIGFITDDREYT